MEILAILTSKLDEIKKSSCYLEVDFKSHEITVIGDITNLRALKLVNKFPVDFKKSNNVQNCYDNIKLTEDIYRVLEYFFICNNVVKSPIVQVFPRILQ